MVARITSRAPWLALLPLALILHACDFEYDNPVEACEGLVCISEVTGVVRTPEGSPVAATECIKVCFKSQSGEICVWKTTDENGVFSFFPDPTAEYAAFDFENEDYIHITIQIKTAPTDESTTYVVAFAPTQEELSEDSVLAIGTHYVYPVSGDTTQYVPGSGAQLLDGTQSGLTINIEPNEMGAIEQTIEAYRFPLDDTHPPFLESYDPDVLYYLTPYFAQFEGPSDPHLVDIEIDAASVDGWSDGDTGTLYMLGDLHNGYLDCGSGEIEVADFVPGDETDTVEDGKIKAQIPRFGWVALKKE